MMVPGEVPLVCFYTFHLSVGRLAMNSTRTTTLLIRYAELHFADEMKEVNAQQKGT
jgi:hypothetical protein